MRNTGGKRTNTCQMTELNHPFCFWICQPKTLLTKGYLVDQWSQLPIYICHHHLSDQLKSPPRGSYWALGKTEAQRVFYSVAKWKQNCSTERPITRNRREVNIHGVNIFCWQTPTLTTCYKSISGYSEFWYHNNQLSWHQQYTSKRDWG